MLRDISRKNARGISLLELMVVVILVGILAGAALPNYRRSIERARVREAQGVLSDFFQSQRLFILDHQRAGTAVEIFDNGYMVDPDAGDAMPDWAFTSNPNGVNFTATATRTGGGGFNGNTITINQNFTGDNFGGTHPLI